MIFFTSDLHFGSQNIITYCERPFKDVNHQTERLIKNINMRCKENDVLYHIGDFVMYGRERGVEVNRIKPVEYEKRINCQVIHILGNHDLNNGVRGAITGCYIKFGKQTAWLQHTPPWDKSCLAPTDADIYLCGHVHKCWKISTYCEKPVINVGCDMWNYQPIKVQDIIKFIQKT